MAKYYIVGAIPSALTALAAIMMNWRKNMVGVVLCTIAGANQCLPVWWYWPNLLWLAVYDRFPDIYRFWYICHFYSCTHISANR